MRSHDKTQLAALSIAVLGASVALLASFLPWGRSGQTARTSYELVGVAVRFDILSAGHERLAGLWYLLPAAAGGVWLAAGLHRPRLAATLSAFVGLLTVVATHVTEQSPLAAEAGVVLAEGAGWSALVAGMIRMTMARSAHA